MKVDGDAYRTIWPAVDGRAVEIIDQTRLPHSFETVRLETLEDAAHAIRAMLVRGAPLIGATAAYGLWLALRADASDAMLARACETLVATRPTAINLKWAVEDVRATVAPLPEGERAAAAFRRAGEICDEDVEINEAIGRHGLDLIREAHRAKDGRGPVNILTHCNAGWLATVDWGTALAPIYKAHDEGIPVFVWVDETRPRNQGAGLTAWELGRHGVPHKVVVDNAGGLLMRRGEVDLCITGTDRTTAAGDVCNKIGTYLKALAAHDNGVPFYVALPGPTIDWSIEDGEQIPIEERDGREVSHIPGRTDDGHDTAVRVTPESSAVANFGFDVTPARLVTALVTERGVCTASKDSLRALYPEHATAAAE
ncbi:S-methyl-5-thioribose-1-phosphate isomerase [Ferruginivarius sediminum]|uniref:Methylthioribose-1-phosphate isomerase n=1 Tax=Ferruginivarius sediminum TaxID=2661937 RepID=A0A369T7J1_9PROT|nr:S-methyl-5-thioribose-1-phosphate isomerase [Ferruginivarius sediminum]RDD61309.1 S-methyl-5-thioribose-1-phosphate isomerase [Ferruginivarius sediminum]